MPPTETLDTSQALGAMNTSSVCDRSTESGIILPLLPNICSTTAVVPPA